MNLKQEEARLCRLDVQMCLSITIIDHMCIGSKFRALYVSNIK